jgi:hypothetical protein
MDIYVWGRLTFVWVIISRKAKRDRLYNDQKKKIKTMIYETLHRKLKIGQHQSTKNWGGHSCFLYHGTLLLSNACSTSGTCCVIVKPHKFLNTKEDNEIRCCKFRSLLGTDRYKNVAGQNASFYVIRSPTVIKKCLDMIGSLWL